MPKKNLKPKQNDVNRIVKVLRSLHFAEYVDFIRSPGRTFLFGFLKGTGTGLGIIVGTAVVITLLAYIINLLGGIPVVGEWIEAFGKIIGAK